VGLPIAQTWKSSSLPLWSSSIPLRRITSNYQRLLEVQHAKAPYHGFRLNTSVAKPTALVPRGIVFVVNKAYFGATRTLGGQTILIRLENWQNLYWSSFESLIASASQTYGNCPNGYVASADTLPSAWCVLYSHNTYSTPLYYRELALITSLLWNRSTALSQFSGLVRELNQRERSDICQYGLQWHTCWKHSVSKWLGLRNFWSNGKFQLAMHRWWIRTAVTISKHLCVQRDLFVPGHFIWCIKCSLFLPMRDMLWLRGWQIRVVRMQFAERPDFFLHRLQLQWWCHWYLHHSVYRLCGYISRS